MENKSSGESPNISTATASTSKIMIITPEQIEKLGLTTTINKAMESHPQSILQKKNVRISKITIIPSTTSEPLPVPKLIKLQDSDKKIKPNNYIALMKSKLSSALNNQNSSTDSSRKRKNEEIVSSSSTINKQQTVPNILKNSAVRSKFDPKTIAGLRTYEKKSIEKQQIKENPTTTINVKQKIHVLSNEQISLPDTYIQKLKVQHSGEKKNSTFVSQTNSDNPTLSGALQPDIIEISEEDIVKEPFKVEAENKSLVEPSNEENQSTDIKDELFDPIEISLYNLENGSPKVEGDGEFVKKNSLLMKDATVTSTTSNTNSTKPEIVDLTKDEDKNAKDPQQPRESNLFREKIRNKFILYKKKFPSHTIGNVSILKSADPVHGTVIKNIVNKFDEATPRATLKIIKLDTNTANSSQIPNNKLDIKENTIQKKRGRKRKSINIDNETEKILPPTEVELSKRGRKRKVIDYVALSEGIDFDADEEEDTNKIEYSSRDSGIDTSAICNSSSVTPKRKRGRPRKVKEDEIPICSEDNNVKETDDIIQQGIVQNPRLTTLNKSNDIDTIQIVEIVDEDEITLAELKTVNCSIDNSVNLSELYFNQTNMGGNCGVSKLSDELGNPENTTGLINFVDAQNCSHSKVDVALTEIKSNETNSSNSKLVDLNPICIGNSNISSDCNKTTAVDLTNESGDISKSNNESLGDLKIIDAISNNILPTTTASSSVISDVSNILQVDGSNDTSEDNSINLQANKIIDTNMTTVQVDVNLPKLIKTLDATEPINKEIQGENEDSIEINPYNTTQHKVEDLNKIIVVLPESFEVHEIRDSNDSIIKLSNTEETGAGNNDNLSNLETNNRSIIIKYENIESISNLTAINSIELESNKIHIGSTNVVESKTEILSTNTQNNSESRSYPFETTDINSIGSGTNNEHDIGMIASTGDICEETNMSQTEETCLTDILSSSILEADHTGGTINESSKLNSSDTLVVESTEKKDCNDETYDVSITSSRNAASVTDHRNVTGVNSNLETCTVNDARNCAMVVGSTEVSNTNQTTEVYLTNVDSSTSFPIIDNHETIEDDSTKFESFESEGIVIKEMADVNKSNENCEILSTKSLLNTDNKLESDSSVIKVKLYSPVISSDNDEFSVATKTTEIYIPNLDASTISGTVDTSITIKDDLSINFECSEIKNMPLAKTNDIRACIQKPEVISNNFGTNASTNDVDSGNPINDFNLTNLSTQNEFSANNAKSIDMYDDNENINCESKKKVRVQAASNLIKRKNRVAKEGSVAAHMINSIFNQINTPLPSNANTDKPEVMDHIDDNFQEQNVTTKSKHGEAKKNKQSQDEFSIIYTTKGNVTCAICEEELEKNNWTRHKMRYHNNLAWRVGETPLDLNDQKFVMAVLNEFYKKKKPLHCYKCGESKKSVMGFLSHKSMCQKSIEEVEALRVECKFCLRTVLPVSMPTHIKFCRKNQATIDTIVENVSAVEESSLTVEGKRKAATRAHKLIKSLKHYGAIEDTSKDKKNVRNYLVNFDFRPTNSEKRILNSEIKKKGTIKCYFEDCTFQTFELEEISNHLYGCDKKPMEGYTCKLCLLTYKTIDEVLQHLATNHEQPHLEEKDLPTEQSSDEDFNEEEYLGISSDDEDNADYDDIAERNSLAAMKCYRSSLLQGIKFILKHRYCAPNTCLSYPAAKKWTLKFCETHLSNPNLFPRYKVASNNWEKLQSTLYSTYLPKLRRSMCVNIVSTPSYVDPNQLEHEWKTYNLFEADDSMIFSGGPIFAMSWAPTPYNKTNCEQIIAISTNSSESESYSLDKKYAEPGLIQFWNYGCLVNGNKPKTPELEFCIAHDFGPIWCLEWCPSGCYDNSDSSDPSVLGRLGLLALGSADSFVYLYSVCYPRQKSGKIFNPKPILKLVLDSVIEDNFNDLEPHITKISWSKASGHQIVAVGYANGLVGVFDLNTTSDLLLLGKDNDGVDMLMPYRIILAHQHAITALCIYHLNDGCRWLMTGSLDRTIKYWDLENQFIPIWNVPRSIITDGIWLNHWLCTINTFDDSCSSGLTATLLHQFRNYKSDQASIMHSNSRVQAISGSEWMNGFIQGNVAGELTAFFPHQLFCGMDSDKSFKKKRAILCYARLVDKSLQIKEEFELKKNKLLAEEKELSEIDVNTDTNCSVYTYSGAASKYGLVFCDMEMESIKDFSENISSYMQSNNEEKYYKTRADVYPMQAINTVAFNPNRESYSYLATGYQAGFVKISYLNFIRN